MTVFLPLELAANWSDADALTILSESVRKGKLLGLAPKEIEAELRGYPAAHVGWYLDRVEQLGSDLTLGIMI